MLPATLILLAGCASGIAVPTDPCGPWRPLTVADADVLTRGTAEQMQAHNLTGERLGCWGVRP
jgi:hypothetical protein